MRVCGQAGARPKHACVTAVPTPPLVLCSTYKNNRACERCIENATAATAAAPLDPDAPPVFTPRKTSASVRGALRAAGAASVASSGREEGGGEDGVLAQYGLAPHPLKTPL